MQNGGSLLEVRVWGEWACFTRPEMKVERVSYPVMTPSAARGVLESIFWKPEFRWKVREVWVLKPIRTMGLVRNEVQSRASPHLALRGYYADEDRVQRFSLILRDVAYLIRADIELAPDARNEHPAKYRDQFRRRVQRGQCFFQPYLGCREFTAFFGPPIPGEAPIDLTEDLGPMLFDLRYDPKRGRAEPLFFHARLERGVLKVPPELYDRLEAGNGAGALS